MLIHSLVLFSLSWLSLSSAQLGDGPPWISPSPPIGQSVEQPAIWAFGDTIHFVWGATNGPYTLTIQATNETYGPQYTTQVSGTTLDWQVNLGTGACTMTLYDGVDKWAISVFCNIVEGSDAASPVTSASTLSVTSVPPTAPAPSVPPTVTGSSVPPTAPSPDNSTGLPWLSTLTTSQKVAFCVGGAAIVIICVILWKRYSQRRHGPY